MTCTSCGGPAPVGAAFCPECGSRVGGDIAATLTPSGQNAAAGTSSPTPTQAREPRYSRRLKWSVAVLLVLLTILGALLVPYLRHASEEECEEALNYAYDAVGLHSISGLRVPWKQSLDSCLGLPRSEVQCILKIGRERRELLWDGYSRIANCPAYAKLKLDREVKEGLFCFRQVSNTSGETVGGECAFSDRECSSERELDVDTSMGSTFSPCQQTKTAYGVPSTEGFESWYALSPTKEICEEKLGRLRNEVNNIAPCCLPAPDGHSRNCPSDDKGSKYGRVLADAESELAADNADGSDTSFTLGSTKEHVQKVQGIPDAVAGETWMYDLSTVSFSGEKLVAYSNSSRNLKISIGERTKGSRGFGIGSSREDVVKAQGTPGAIIGNTWMYDLSTVTFAGDKVTGYSNISGNLRLVSPK